MSSNGHLHAEEWDVRPIPKHWDARAFIAQYHYARGAGIRSTYRHGLYRADEEILALLFGATIWAPPTQHAAIAIAGEDDWTGVLSLSRLAVHPDVPTNGASFLLGRSMKMIDRRRWPVLVTYADTRHGHTGAIYKATNWRCDGEVPAGDVWIDRNGRQEGRKRGDSGSRSAATMRALGFERAPNAPKIRFVHDVRR